MFLASSFTQLKSVGVAFRALDSSFMMDSSVVVGCSIETYSHFSGLTATKSLHTAPVPRTTAGVAAALSIRLRFDTGVLMSACPFFGVKSPENVGLTAGGLVLRASMSADIDSNFRMIISVASPDSFVPTQSSHFHKRFLQLWIAANKSSEISTQLMWKFFPQPLQSNKSSIESQSSVILQAEQVFVMIRENTRYNLVPFLDYDSS